MNTPTHSPFDTESGRRRKAEAGVLARLRRLLGDVVPDCELRTRAELAVRIEASKARRGAVILAHNYMEPALFHSVADHTGDSLELCRKAAAVESDVIVFCGVRFMAETAKVLNPGKTVLLPDPDAGCSLAESITADDVRGLRLRFPGVPVVAYVNTSAEVKAEVDLCCTSGNASRVVESLDADTVILLPDEYLARNVAIETGKKILVASPAGAADVDHDREQGTVVGWNGRCEVHEKFTPTDVADARRQFPDVTVLAHPECSPEVLAVADFSGSTAAMIRFVTGRTEGRYLLLTECSMGDNIAATHPAARMLRICSVRCPHMNRITMEQTLAALELDRYRIELPDDVCRRAARSLRRMLEIG